MEPNARTVSTRRDAGAGWRRAALLGVAVILGAAAGCDAGDLSSGAPGVVLSDGGGARPDGASSSDQGPACAAPRSDCAGDCVSLMDDPQHCGACGHRCGVGQKCNSGQCADCSPGLTLCNAGCVDLAGDAKNCGACGTSCGAMQLCTAGKCSCPATLTLCGNACVDLATDKNNCGRCGNGCLIQMCALGQCGSFGGGCAPGRTLCGKLCVDLNGDASNCGACGMACPQGHICAIGRCF